MARQREVGNKWIKKGRGRENAWGEDGEDWGGWGEEERVSEVR
jgi:hypothetical protein